MKLDWGRGGKKRGPKLKPRPSPTCRSADLPHLPLHPFRAHHHPSSCGIGRQIFTCLAALPLSPSTVHRPSTWFILSPPLSGFPSCSMQPDSALSVCSSVLFCLCPVCAVLFSPVPTHTWHTWHTHLAYPTHPTQPSTHCRISLPLPPFYQCPLTIPLHLTSPHLTSPHLTSPHLISSHVTQVPSLSDRR